MTKPQDHHPGQGGLFDPDHTNARVSDPMESHLAAEANPVGRSKARYQILATVAMHPANTWDRIWRLSGVNPPSSVSRMLTDLKRKDLIRVWAKGVTESGSQAAQYVITAKGTEALK